MPTTPRFNIDTEDTPAEYHSLGKYRVVARQPEEGGETAVLYYSDSDYTDDAWVVKEYLNDLQSHDLPAREAHVSYLARVLGVDLRVMVGRRD